MHCPAGHLLPGPRFITELLPPHPEPFANTCHPLSITKSPVVASPWCPQSATTASNNPLVPPWCPQSAAAAASKNPLVSPWCPQSATTASNNPLVSPWCPQSAAAAVSTLPCRPLVQKYLLMFPDSCETAQLLPTPRVSDVLQNSESPRRDKKRVARSLPPCAPRCPEPSRLRFPPCGIRCSSSASCCGQCGSRRVTGRPPSRAEVTGGYSPPLRGVTECPPQRYSFLREDLTGEAAVAPHRCSKGYPTQEFVTCCYSSEQRLSSTGGVVKGTQECPQLRGAVKECPQLRGAVKECPQLRAGTKETKECHQLRAVTKECPQLRGVTKECHQLRAVTKGTKECPQLRAVPKVTKEYPPLRAVTKECPQLKTVTKVTKECPPLRGVTKECHQLRGVTKVTKEYPPLRAVTKGTKECPPLRAVALLEGTKGRSCSAQQLSRSRCPQHPRGPPRPSRLTTAGVKRSGHSKKSRCASKWLW